MSTSLNILIENLGSEAESMEPLYEGTTLETKLESNTEVPKKEHDHKYGIASLESQRCLYTTL